jgi:hypothetical protein
MAGSGIDSRLAQLLEHPAIWRGRSAARIPVLPTGFPALDESLPGGGWPSAGIVEILTAARGLGELRLLAPLLAALTGAVPARWSVLVAPPFEPFPPAFVAHGIALESLLVVRTAAPLWAVELALRSGSCAAVLAWVERARPRHIRRLQLAAEQGRTLGILLRLESALKEPSPASLRILFEPTRHGARLTLVKSRGGARGSVEVSWNGDADG